MHSGGCLCGRVSIEIRGELPAPDACHCTKCRKFSGHYFVSADVPRDAVTVSGQEHISWYESSPKVRRGFCSNCGSSLFFDPIDRVKNPWIAIALGALDRPTDTHLAKHIFVADKGDYYTLDDCLPQHDG